MINGVRLSEIDLINKNRNQHLKRLEKIHGSKSKKYEQSDNFIKMLKTRRDNHEKWKTFTKHEQEKKLYLRNEKLFDKLMDLTLEDSPYSYSAYNSQSQQRRTTYRHHNSKIQNLRKIKAIDEQNPEIARRIMEKTGSLNYKRDLQNFRKTRAIVNRIQKFPQFEKMSNFRSKTLPSRKVKTEEKGQDSFSSYREKIAIN